MRIQLETITNQVDRSFTTMFNPRLSDLFFWHFHPEYELVFIDNASGKRRVGEHVSDYQKSDLALIGSNIPHLNWDYGVRTEYKKVVVHIKKEFAENHLVNIPEFAGVAAMFDHARHGMVFKGPASREIGNKLFSLEGMCPQEQYLHLVRTLSDLAQIEEYELLHEAPYVIRSSDKDHSRLQEIYSFVDNNYARKVDLQEIADVSNMTREAFCRYFKKATHYTFTEFLNRYRISQSKRLMTSGSTISEACFQTGFESLSYFNRTFKRVAGENPSDFRKRFRTIAD